MTARASILTGEGRGAVGVIRVEGPSALAIADRLFRPARGPCLSGSPPRAPRFGRMGAGLGDEVVALVLEGDPPPVEIHGHGGSAALDSILAALRSEGIEIAATNPDELEGALSRAPTLRVAQILMDQAGVAFDRLFADGPPDPALVEALLRRSEVGLRLIDGWKVVLTGRPNVGKSRLLNALAGFDRAIVSSQAGTTRDLVSARTAIDGWPVELIDTAGIREGGEALEQAGMALTHAAGARANLVVVVLDRSEPLTAEDRRILDAWPGALLTANKADRPAAWDQDEIDGLAVSAMTGEGLPELLAAISRRLVPEPPPAGAVVPFTAQQVARLQAIRSGPTIGD